MSGYKRATVSISQEEYDRLHEAEIRLRSLPDFSPSDQQAINQHSIQVLQTNLSQFLDRQARYESSLSHLSSQLTQAENRTIQQLSIVQQQLLEDAQANAGALWDYVNKQLDQTSTQIGQVVQTNHQQVQDQIQDLVVEINQQHDSEAQKQRYAEDWLTAASNLCEFIRQNYSVEQFFPHRFSRLEQQLFQINGNLDVGFYETVLGAAQDLYLNLSDLRVELERLEYEWQLLLASALETTQLIYAQAVESQVVPAYDLDGQELPYQVQVDDWTDRRLSELITELDGLTDQLAYGPYPDLETLRSLVDTYLPGRYQYLQDLVIDARILALNSQLRINIADLVVQALQDQGFALANAEYEEQDQQRAFNACLTNQEGSEVWVTVEPGQHGFGENELHLRSQDSAMRTEHELVQRWKEISRSLQYYGLQVSPYQKVTAKQPDRHRNVLRNQKRSIDKNQRHAATGL